MTSLLSARRRAEEFAALADGSVPPSEVRPELAELTDVLTALRAVSAPAPSPAFTASLRERLMAEADTVLAASPATQALTLPPRTRGARERRLTAAAAFVLVGGSAGMAAAAQNALPGEALYPLKRGLEAADASLATSQAGKGRDLLASADDRLGEVESLLGTSQTRFVAATVEDFSAQALEGSALLLDSFEDSRDPAVLEEVGDFTTRSTDTLQTLAASAPAEVQDELAQAALVLDQIGRDASAACGACPADLPSPAVPPLWLASAEADRALAAVRAAQLDNDHPRLSEATPRRSDREPGNTPEGSGAPAPAGGEGVPSRPTGSEDGDSGLLPPEVGLPTNLPEVDKTVKETVKDLDEVTGGTLGTVGDDVEEILPDDLGGGLLD